MVKFYIDRSSVSICFWKTLRFSHDECLNRKGFLVGDGNDVNELMSFEALKPSAIGRRKTYRSC